MRIVLLVLILVGVARFAAADDWTYTPADQSFTLTIPLPDGWCRVPPDMLEPRSILVWEVDSRRIGAAVSCADLEKAKADSRHKVQIYAVLVPMPDSRYPGMNQAMWNTAIRASVASRLQFPPDAPAMQKRIRDAVERMEQNDTRDMGWGLDANATHHAFILQRDFRPESRRLTIAAAMILKEQTFTLFTVTPNLQAEHVMSLMAQSRAWAKLIQDANR